jgi:predicted SnoaL-like aldol condensation-catalyzing enzyme
MNANNKEIVTNFVEEIWNQNQFDKLDKYIHPAFADHSLPSVLPPNKEGLRRWITGTGQSFEHKTIIEEIVCEENKVMLKIKMLLKHIGKYRYVKLAGNKIIEHWALLDGNTIENQLKQAAHGCKPQE